MLALGKLRPIGRNQQRQVRKLRYRGPQRLKNQNMLERVRQMVLAADDMADAQIGVIGARCQMIRWHPVRTQQREVLNVVAGFRLIPVNAVLKRDRA